MPNYPQELSLRWNYVPLSEILQGTVKIGVLRKKMVVRKNKFKLMSTAGNVAISNSIYGAGKEKLLKITDKIKPGSYQVTAFFTDPDDSPDVVYISVGKGKITSWKNQLNPKLDLSKPGLANQPKLYNNGYILVGDADLLKKVTRNESTAEQYLNARFSENLDKNSEYISLLLDQPSEGNILEIKTAGDGSAAYYLGYGSKGELSALVIILDPDLLENEFSFLDAPKPIAHTQAEKQALELDRKELLEVAKNIPEVLAEHSAEQVANYLYKGVTLGITTAKELGTSVSELKSLVVKEKQALDKQLENFRIPPLMLTKIMANSDKEAAVFKNKHEKQKQKANNYIKKVYKDLKNK